jgi:hypothetical protein
MAAPREQEAREASAAFHAAMIYLGIQALDDALDAWAVVPPTPGQAPAALGRWLAKAVSQVLKGHDRARDLAVAYYRLHRALYTGSTIQDLDSPGETSVTLGELRKDFRDIVAGVGSPTTTSDLTEAALERAEVNEAPAKPRLSSKRKSDDKLVIKVEKVAGLEEALKADRAELEDAIRTSLEVTGADSLTRKLRAIPKDQPAKAVDDRRDQAHSTAGHTQASSAARHVMNGARAHLQLVGAKDRRAIGWVRVSGTGTPCGFCAMLISRGVFYSSEKAAGGAGADDYHDNCFCYAEPIYSNKQFATDPRFALNRQYRAEWQRLIADKGLKGNRALNAWRTHIRNSQQAGTEKTTQGVA